VNAVAVSSASKLIYSVGDGAVKSWDLSQRSGGSDATGSVTVAGNKKQLQFCIALDEERVLAGGGGGSTALHICDTAPRAATQVETLSPDRKCLSAWPAWEPSSVMPSRAKRAEANQDPIECVIRGCLLLAVEALLCFVLF